MLLLGKSKLNNTVNRVLCYSNISTKCLILVDNGRNATNYRGMCIIVYVDITCMMISDLNVVNQ